jgi:hypothetical protein
LIDFCQFSLEGLSFCVQWRSKVIVTGVLKKEPTQVPAIQTLSLCRNHHPADALQLTLTYRSEKEEWINEVMDASIAVTIAAAAGDEFSFMRFRWGSGEAIDEVVEGDASLTSSAPPRRHVTARSCAYQPCRLPESSAPRNTRALDSARVAEASDLEFVPPIFRQNTKSSLA